MLLQNKSAIKGIEVSFNKMISMGYSLYEALQAVLDLKKPGIGYFKSMHELEKWLIDVETTKQEDQNEEYWNSLLINPTVVVTNSEGIDLFNHPLWEDCIDPSYYWN